MRPNQGLFEMERISRQVDESIARREIELNELNWFKIDADARLKNEPPKRKYRTYNEDRRLIKIITIVTVVIFVIGYILYKAFGG